MAGGAHQPREVSGRRKRPRHVSHAHQKTRGKLLSSLFYCRDDDDERIPLISDCDRVQGGSISVAESFGVSAVLQCCLFT